MSDPQTQSCCSQTESEPVQGVLLAPSLDPAMMEELRNLADGDTAFVQDVLVTYLEQAGEIVTAMRGALNANDARAFRLAAHALGGSSLQVGAAQVARICRAIQSSEDDTPAPFAEALDEIGSELHRVFTAAAQLSFSR
jgi:HPt (histidine-containing phosphotransfer) domain-containing protein